MLESTDVFDHSDCGLPVAAQVARLDRFLTETFGGRFEITTVDLYSLEGVARDEALDAVVAGKPSPFVLLDEHVVCSGAVDPDAVMAAITSRSLLT